MNMRGKHRGERREMIQNLKEERVRFDLVEFFRKNSKEKCYGIVLHYLKMINIIERI